MNPATREVDYCDDSVTENTRAAYPHGELLFMRRLAVGIAHRSATARCSCGGWQVRVFGRPLFPPACRPPSLGAYATGCNDDGKPPLHRQIQAPSATVAFPPKARAPSAGKWPSHEA